MENIQVENMLRYNVSASDTCYIYPKISLAAKCTMQILDSFLQQRYSPYHQDYLINMIDNKYQNLVTLWTAIHGCRVKHTSRYNSLDIP